MSTGKKKLYTFGCSYTFGHGFPDCGNDDDIPSKFAWPQLLADALDMDCMNFSVPGCSPFELTRIFMRQADKIQPDDSVVILWPSAHRWPLFWGPNKHNVLKFFPGGMDEEISIDHEHWVSVGKFYSDYTTDYQMFEIYLHMTSLVDNTCKLKNINVLHYDTCVEQLAEHRCLLKHHNYKWYDVKLERLGFNKFAYNDVWKTHFGKEFGRLPDGHFDSDTHEIFAEAVRRRLIRNGFVDS